MLMRSFIEASCCHGIQPAGVISRKRASRLESVAKLLKDRKVARFILAPDGYGKTHVAFEYASIMFAFQNVFWIKAASPCFVRDLDARTLKDEIASVDPDARLVVFDGLPTLDPERAEALSSLVDDLLGEGREVLITCAPHADMYGNLQKDRVVCSARDLLLGAMEVAALGLEKVPHSNIACVAWDPKGAALLMKGCADEVMPADVRLALFILLALGEGALDGALAFFDQSRREEITEHLHGHYTFLGIDLDRGAFKAIPLSARMLKERLMPAFDDVLSAASAPNGDALAAALADQLLSMDETERACELLISYGSAESVAAWVEQRGWRMLWSGDALSVRELIACAFKRRSLTTPMRLLSAWASWLLEDEQGARQGCSQVASSKTATAEEKVVASPLLVRLSDDVADPGRSLMLAEALTVLEERGEDGISGRGCEAQGMDWPALARLLFPLTAGELPDEEECAHLMRRAFSPEDGSEPIAPMNALLVGLAWAIELGASSETRDPKRDERLQRLASLFAMVVKGASGRAHEDAAISRSVAVGLLCAAKACEAQPPVAALLGEMAARRLAEAAGKVQMNLDEQARSFRMSAEREHERKAAFDATHPDIFRFSTARPVIAVSSVPQLEIRMFGGLEVRIDGQMIDPRKLSRRRAKVLTCVLALNKGHEMTRERLCDVVWDGSRFDECKNSFYSIWAVLKHALSIDGDCPYLIRSQTGCSLDARYLSTDMEDFESICSMLVFGGTDSRSWEEAYGQVVTTYADALLPTERENAYLNDVRERCRSRMVDGLISASGRLLRVGERTGALWFSREALRRDEEREDVYISLMEAQIAADQRGPALETYFKCRKFMTGDLGIDPSPHLVELYRSIIEYEEAI